jgi:hypothetical protein
MKYNRHGVSPQVNVEALYRQKNNPLLYVNLRELVSDEPKFADKQPDHA